MTKCPTGLFSPMTWHVTQKYVKRIFLMGQSCFPRQIWMFFTNDGQPLQCMQHVSKVDRENVLFFLKCETSVYVLTDPYSRKHFSILDLQQSETIRFSIPQYLEISTLFTLSGPKVFTILQIINACFIHSLIKHVSEQATWFHAPFNPQSLWWSHLPPPQIHNIFLSCIPYCSQTHNPFLITQPGWWLIERQIKLGQIKLTWGYTCIYYIVMFWVIIAIWHQVQLNNVLQ